MPRKIGPFVFSDLPSSKLSKFDIFYIAFACLTLLDFILVFYVGLSGIYDDWPYFYMLWAPLTGWMLILTVLKWLAKLGDPAWIGLGLVACLPYIIYVIIIIALIVIGIASGHSSTRAEDQK